MVELWTSGRRKYYGLAYLDEHTQIVRSPFRKNCSPRMRQSPAHPRLPAPRARPRRWRGLRYRL